MANLLFYLLLCILFSLLATQLSRWLQQRARKIKAEESAKAIHEKTDDQQNDSAIN